MCKAIEDWAEELLTEGEAKGEAKGKAEERKAIVERMRKNGYTEEQIRIIIGDDKQE